MKHFPSFIFPFISFLSYYHLGVTWVIAFSAAAAAVAAAAAASRPIFLFSTSMSGLSKITSKRQPNCHQKVHKAHSPSTQVSNNAGSNSAQSYPPDRSTMPLSGNPYFTALVVKSHVQHPYQLVIPRRFNKSLPNRMLQVFLTHKGRTWEMKMAGKSIRKRLCCGWREFAVDNRLKIGDGCIFELMDDDGELKFGVQILDGQIPFKFRQEVAGEVIIID